MALVHIRAAVQQMSATLHDAMAPGTMAWLEQVMAPAMVDYHPDPGQAPGLDAITHAGAGLRDTFPDLQLTCRATHHGALLGFPATDRQVTYVLFDHLRLNGGKMVERWGMPDALGLLLQVGLTVPQA